MYITRLFLENFQSHAASEFIFVNGYNAIFSESGGGKTAVWRALRWVIYNRPQNAEVLIRGGAKACRVEVSFSNGLTVIRERLRDRESRTLLRGPKTSMEAPEFLASIGLATIVLENGREITLNLASQVEESFLLDLPPSLREALLKRVTGRKLLESAVAAAGKTSILDTAPDGPSSAVHSFSSPAPALTPHELREQVGAFLEATLAYTLDYERKVVERIVTYVVQYVFGAGYRFKMRHIYKPPGITFLVASDCGGTRIEYEPLEAGGGGLVDVLALALRFALLEMAHPPNRGPLILDEPAKNVSDAYIAAVARLLKTLADVFERQIIVTTSNQHLVGTADALYILQLEDGASKVHRR